MTVPTVPTPLRVAALVELVSLVILLGNLATVHWAPVASLLGPLHGCAYLFVVVATARRRPFAPRLVLTALLPGIGGMLALRRLTAAEVAADMR
ncbi:DUF3817 domain-containing protein [Micromonospora sp. NPDC049559]|uniref:DUF3817 domain-containing protein n=1 Tax=Micromonospora sp. NPDC049559 TaxID=3155923 RepID=UPI003438040B